MQGIARQVNRSGETAAGDDVIVTEGGQRTGPVHEYDEARFGRNDIEGVPDKWGGDEARGRRLTRGRWRNLPGHATCESGSQQDCAEDAERVRDDATPLMGRIAYRITSTDVS